MNNAKQAITERKEASCKAIKWGVYYIMGYIYYCGIIVSHCC